MIQTLASLLLARCRLHILFKVALHIASRKVVSHHVRCLALGCSPNTNLLRSHPHQLGEVTRVCGESRLRIVVALYLLVPGVCSLLSRWRPPGVKEEILAQVPLLQLVAGAMLQPSCAGQVIRPTLGNASGLNRPGERRGTMHPAESVVLANQFPAELVRTSCGRRWGRQRSGGGRELNAAVAVDTLTS